MRTLRNILLLIASLCVTLLLLEGIARLFVDFDANYYAAPKLVKKGSVRKHPYGDIPINSLGYFDGEFEKNAKPSIAYFGDSVAYGVGAGYPFRITEFLEDLQPDANHLNLSDGIGTDADNISLNRLAALQEQFELSKVIYLMNLNDVLPAYRSVIKKSDTPKATSSEAAGRSDTLVFLFQFKNYFDQWRGKSMLYTWARNIIKTQFMQQGYDIDGYKSVELLPEENKELVQKAAKGLNQWADKIRELGLKPCIAILPYEMQISKDAARTYRELNINFSKGFENFLTQELLVERVRPDVEVIVLGKSIPEKPVGTYFVFNKGDRIDFNHPNRAGHKLLAEEMHQRGFCK